MNKYMSHDQFLEWHNNALRDYVEKQWPNGGPGHILDLAVATASFSESFYLIIEHMPD
jgi:hypothetical protein